MAGRFAALEGCDAAFGAAFGAAFALAFAFAWEAAAGRGVGAGVAAALGVGDAAGGSDVMMLTGGIEAEDGNSASVGLPVGIECCPPINAAAAAGLVDAPEPESAAADAPLHIGV